MTAIPCPFCGVSKDVPHETQGACIAALHDEIARMRALADQVRSSQAEPEQPKTARREPAGRD